MLHTQLADRHGAGEDGAVGVLSLEFPVLWNCRAGDLHIFVGIEVVGVVILLVIMFVAIFLAVAEEMVLM